MSEISANPCSSCLETGTRSRWPVGCSRRTRQMMTSGRKRTSRAAGFTLVELMITVAIVGVLAVLATVGYARWTRTAKTGEATSMIAGIKGAQESYRAEALRYLDVSGGNIDNYYPQAAPTDQKAPWNPKACAGTAVCDNFRILNVQADSNVYYRYSTIAGPPDGAVRTVDGHTYPAANDPWYVVKARGDLNNNGKIGQFWSSSFDGTIWSKDSDE
ncbi:MAG: type IV pilin protein [Polyangiales bacterium]